MFKSAALAVLGLVAATGFALLYSAAIVLRLAYALTRLAVRFAAHLLLPTPRTSPRGWCTVPKHLNHTA